MNTDLMHLAGIDIEVVQKPIKNLHIGVYPPDGRVRVAAPPSMSFDAVRVALLTRLPWIERKRRGFADQPRETPRQFVSGETHFFLGRPLRLKVQTIVEGRARIELEGTEKIRMYIKQNASLAQRQHLISEWYRNALRAHGQSALDKWANRLGISVPTLGIRRMRTKWGSCNHTAGRVWLNLSLAKKPPVLIDYVTLHECAHFISAKHDDRFVAVLDKCMPRWKNARAELNRLPLDAW